MMIHYATIILRETADGGLRMPMPLPTPALLLRFSQNQTLTVLGVRIEGDVKELRPGKQFLVRMAPVLDEDSTRIRAGQEFELWYNRVVGKGRVLT